MIIMKKFVSKNVRIIIAIVVGVLVFAPAFHSKASDNDYGFDFKLKPNCANSGSSSRYRETTSVNNPWKVRLKNSTEGKGTIASFWLGTYDRNTKAVQGSTIMNVKQGAKARYCGAYKIANKNTTYLAAENNNYTSKTYYVDGVWDEETW
ncbi:DUF2712 domain-containing protein [Listeria welshimeri]|uniref:DUF2712 domain-containing protein n=1 Tax=Listeria welshimeri TaxID=1643 RepID=UPI001888F347|nr:DUF2712 domain-containing protein [Listeria welshimeri]MBF2356247.1 DUF2712 domain-containing protein [Listeria welshimeri]